MKTKIQKLKTGIIILTNLFVSFSLIAQSPEKMSYQAVVRNSNNELVTNQNIGIRIQIMRTSEFGEAVYVETQNPTTNKNGLLSIEIGGASAVIVTGSFSSIDWQNGPYFIKSEIDPTGGTSYSITGISQILSVPYALYAKTAEQFSGTISESDPLFIAWNKDYNDLINRPNIPDSIKVYADGSETKITGGTNITVLGDGTIGNPYAISTKISHYVGEIYGGGVIFWVDNTGEHGLICSMINISTYQVWSNVTSPSVGSMAQSDWNGLGNSQAIVLQNGHTSSAAKICLDYINSNYGNGIYDDWYLPSRGEMNHLWNNIYEVQKALANDGTSATTEILITYYWSSSECDDNQAWFFDFGHGTIVQAQKGDGYSVRAVRAF